MRVAQMKGRMGEAKERMEEGIEREREREMGEVLPDLTTAHKADLPVRPSVS